MKKILIAYFSKNGENIINDKIVDIGENGFTKIASKTLRDLLLNLGKNPTLFEITPLNPYDFSYSAAAERSHYEKDHSIQTPIKSGPLDWDDYDIVFIGFPNWWGTFPSPVSTFLKNHDFVGKKVIPFITHGGQLFMYSLDDMKPYIGGATFCEGFAIASPYIDKAESLIKKWIETHKEIID